VAQRARRLGLELTAPASVRDGAFLARLEELAPDVAVVVAFGQIFRRRLLALPRHGCINLHASLLPRWRGAAPIQAAIAHGDERTGVTTMRMTAGLDSGPILLQEAVDVGPHETAPELAARLAALGARLMVRTLELLEAGALVPRPQDERLVTLAPRLSREDGAVTWTLSATVLYNRWRAYTPWPGLVAEVGGAPLKLLAVRPAPAAAAGAAPGTVLDVAGDAVVVACGERSALALERVQRPGRRPLAASAWLRGERLRPGDVLRTPSPDPANASP